MTTLESLRTKLKSLLPSLAKRYHVASLALFGSFVRGDQNGGSDLDVLVTFSKTPGLLKFVELENALSDELGVKVDLVMPDALKPGISRRVAAEAVAV
jgi:predicted nucleotidyltransferase